ncbi:hypothetical protein ACWEPH_23380 [Nocardia beijingensis]|uniref:hypothetical protein n=1 Tax=Nocardia beijingensis TaxID=95162 RepID=UPI001892EC97|nr:hypothetical protein [Nocardia beijingensis]MBF6075887.1 hypothetical protein [Nocardia beijingensis]
MANNALPHRKPFVGPAAAPLSDVPADVVGRLLNALQEWQFEQTHTDRPDQEI